MIRERVLYSFCFLDFSPPLFFFFFSFIDTYVHTVLAKFGINNGRTPLPFPSWSYVYIYIYTCTLSNSNVIYV